METVLPPHDRLIWITMIILITVVSLLITPSRCSHPHSPATSAKHDNFTDLEALLDFRAHVSDPHGFLAANWTTSASFCSWAGVHCSRRRQRVAAIRLRDLSLRGTISPHLGNLSFLRELVLFNNSLTGSIPESIAFLPRLERLFLEFNCLSGLFPSRIFNLSSLIYLYVGTNNLTGSLPSNNSFAMPPRLRGISLLGNRFTGDVGLSSFLRCRGIQVISLSQNRFTGTVPSEVGSLSELLGLYLARNRLTGTIPPRLGNLTKLIVLDLGSSNFSGTIPRELGNLANLQILSLADSGNMVGSIPSTLLNISNLRNFDLGGNKPMLEWFSVAENQLHGALEFLSSLSNCRNLRYLQISENSFQGRLPHGVGNLSVNLWHFTAFGNLIEGNIPSALGNLSGLIDLELANNELTGTIPPTLARLESLQYMNLASNALSGLVPSELGLMKELAALSLEHNKLFGPIPESLANMTMLEELRLGNNKFSTSIPKSLWTFPRLLVLDLSVNDLNGSLPPQVSSLKALTSLNLSTNLLSGNITGSLGGLSMLQYLDVSKNSFQDRIPESLGELISAISINLSHNFLSGSIPKSLANLPYLVSVDLSFNNLEGKVPTGRVFLNSSIPILIENKALCGAPQFHIPPCENPRSNHSRRKALSLKYILLVTILGASLATFCCLVYVFYPRRKLKSSVDTNVPHLDYHRAISHHELVRATENFNEANLIGRGGFGSVFRGCLDDGLIVAIKVLNLDVRGSSESFDAECQILKMVRHKNLIKIISVCSNLDFKALILEYMPNGSLEKLLYSEIRFLNLLQRLNIMLDVSLALEHLHHHHPQVVLHCDLKPTNILLDEELVAHVSDFGIAKQLLCNGKSMATASMPGTIGYIAPEYATTGRVSRMGDVYSFGILLLETLTRTKPTDSIFGEQSSLREWICRAYPDAITDVVDKNILKNHDAHDDLQKLHQGLSSLIELGLLCSNYSPKERIPMTHVVTRLQKIKIEYLSS